MSRLDWSVARARESNPRDNRVRLTRPSRRFVTRQQAENAARYVNLWGEDGTEWTVQVTEDGHAFELAPRETTEDSV
jgi:hypothetical protein